MSDITLRTVGIMPVDDVCAQVQLIQNLMKSVMKEKEHYGTIPGCGEKPTLLKPGAEKIGLTFQLIPTYSVERIDLPGMHREYQITCQLHHSQTGVKHGEGVGTCTTMESKYRFRTGPSELTDIPVPREYWDLRKSDPAKALEMIGGKGHSTKKNDAGQWVVALQGERVEHDNPADYYNTCLKIAKKRAHVDAILNATAASDIFTQDIEDMEDNGVVVQNGAGNKDSKPTPPQQKQPDGDTKERPTREELDAFEDRMILHLGTTEAVSEWLVRHTEKFKKIESVTGITTKKWLANLEKQFNEHVAKSGKNGNLDFGQ